jgi:hypothetical protein
LNIAADLLVPTDSSGDISQAGLFLRSQALGAGGNLLAGASAGFWIALESTGQVQVERLDTDAVIAYSGAPVSFDNTVTHNLQIAAQGSNLQVAIDGKLLAFSENGLVSSTVTLPATGGEDDGAAGILFGDEPNLGMIGGQRAANLVISPSASLSALPVQNNFQDRFEPDGIFAAAANLGVGPGVHRSAGVLPTFG